MPAQAKKKAVKPAKASATPKEDHTRLWLMYPSKKITQPIIWQLAQKFKVITNERTLVHSKTAERFTVSVKCM